jgi:predicted AAA+ superfamily ATPase
MIDRLDHAKHVARLLSRFPVVALLGPRQVGKSTLARVVGAGKRDLHVFDLESPRDEDRLRDPMLALERLRGLVVIDEVQRRPELFPALRVLADRPKTPARFLLLGSASPSLLRQSSESLAGRIAFHELTGFSHDEVPPNALDRLWLRGGFPRSFLARSEAASFEWREQFVRTYLERELGELGLGMPAATLQRFWAMLAHHHAQLWNASELGRAFGVADTTVRRYLDALTGTFLVRQLQPWHENISKRQVKAPKLYVSDTGLLHTLLGVRTRTELERHPKIGASWEGFAIDAVIRHLGVDRRDCYFWATHGGAELDLLVVRGDRRYGFEVKRTDSPRVTPSMRAAQESLGLTSLEVLYPGPDTYALGEGIRAVSLGDLSPIRPLC